MATDGGIIFERPAGVASGGFFCEGVSPKKSLVKIGEPSHTRRIASDRGEFSPNVVAILEFGPGRVSSGQGQASAAVRAREIGYCGIASGVVDRRCVTRSPRRRGRAASVGFRGQEPSRS